MDGIQVFIVHHNINYKKKNIYCRELMFTKINGNIIPHKKLEFACLAIVQRNCLKLNMQIPTILNYQILLLKYLKLKKKRE